jgi:predicted enzyme related to lactoylglutathione lyase
LTPVHLDFVIANLDEAVGQLLNRGASLDRPVAAREYGKIANMADPFGNGFDLIEFSGTGYAEVARDQ